MKDSETKQQFMALKAKGKSYESISRELGVSKTALLKWGSAHREEIANLRALDHDALQEEYWLTARAQVTLYGRQVQRIVQELERRDLSTVTTSKLLDTLIKYNAELRRAFPPPILKDDGEIAAAKEARMLGSSLGVGDDGMRSEDLVRLQMDVLRRYKEGAIDDRAAMLEMELINRLYKHVEAMEKRHKKESNDAAESAAIWEEYANNIKEYRKTLAAQGGE